MPTPESLHTVRMAMTPPTMWKPSRRRTKASGTALKISPMTMRMIAGISIRCPSPYGATSTTPHMHVIWRVATGPPGPHPAACTSTSVSNH